MDIAAVAQAVYAGNNLAVTWTDSTGSQRRDNMSPRAQNQFLKVLLVMPPAQAGDYPERGPFVAKNLRMMTTKDGVLGLEVTIGPQMTIQIVLPKPLPDALKDMLSQDPSKWQGPTVN